LKAGQVVVEPVASVAAASTTGTGTPSGGLTGGGGGFPGGGAGFP
jgi:hypothetical protein